MQRVHIFSAMAVVITAFLVVGVASAWKAWSPLAKAETPSPSPSSTVVPTVSPSPEVTLGFSLEQFLDHGSATEQSATSIDSYFQDGLDLSGPKQNLTQVYKAQVGQPGGKNLVDFVKTQPLVTALPMVKPEEVLVDQTLATTEGTAQYSALVEASPALAGGLALQHALEQLPSGQVAAVTEELGRWQKAVTDLRAQHVPPAAKQLHRLLIGYTESMAALLQQVARWNEDQVAALVAIRQMDGLDRTYTPILEQEIQKL